jgi:hypothetical protein
MGFIIIKIINYKTNKVKGNDINETGKNIALKYALNIIIKVN